MHTYFLRKRLGAHVLLAVFLAALSTSLASTFIRPTPAHALDSSNGHAAWLTPNLILYTDDKGHKLLFHEQGGTSDAKGTDSTTFWTESVAQYVSDYPDDKNICDADGEGGGHSYQHSDPGLKKDTYPVAKAHVDGITQYDTSSDPQYPHFHVDWISGNDYGEGCVEDHGADLKDNKMDNRRPDGTVPPQYVSGSLTWTSPYTLEVSSDITPDKNGPMESGDPWDSSSDSWVESPIAAKTEFDQSSNAADGTMTFTAVPPLPSNAPTACGFTISTVIPYLDNLSWYPYAKVYVPHVISSNGTYCGDAPLAAWVKVTNGRPAPPPIDDRITAAWTDINTLQTTGSLIGQDDSPILDSGAVFKNSSVTGNDMVLTDADAPICGTKHNTLEVNPYSLAPYAELIAYSYGQNQRCVATNINIALTTPYPTSSVDNTGGSSNNSSGDNSGNSSFGSNCPIKGDGDWLFCMIAGVFSGAITLLSNGLEVLLYTPVEQIFTGQMQTVFDSFRNIGVALLVIVGLFMVLSQAAGLEIFAAYTVRKALPRLVLAMIGLSLAWPILQFVVTFFNDLGAWTMQLILSSTAGISTGAPFGSFQFGSTAISVAAIVAGFVFSAGIMLSLLGTLLLALLVGFIVLAIRQMVILIAILMAPLAIAASILPGTQKIWSFWRETLLTALAMFPIMMAFLGAGEALSVIAGAAAESTPDAGKSITWKLLSIFCLIGALAALPFAFRIAGGLVSTAHSLVSGSKLGKGMFNRLSEYRGKKAAERWEDTKAGRLMRPGSLFSRVPGVDKASDFLSKGASTGALIASGHFDRGRRNAYRANAEAAHAMEVGGKDTDFAPARGNEDYYLAGLRGYRYKTGRKVRNAAGEEVDEYAETDGSEAGARRYYQAKGYTGSNLRNAVGQTTMMKRKLGQHGFEIAAAMYTPGSGTAFAEGGVEEMDKVIANAARGDRALAAQILNVARQNAGQAGRIDLSGAGFAMHLNEIANVMAGGQANGDRLMQEAFMSTDAVTLSRARKNGLTLVMDAVTKEMNDLQAKQPMTVAIEGQIQGIETQLKDPTVTGTVRANLQAQLNGVRKNYATAEEQRSLGRLKEGLEKLRGQALMYAAPERNIPIFEAVNNTRSAQDEVNLRVKAAGDQTVDPVTGNIAPRPLNQQTAYGAEEQRDPYRRGYNPNDPNNQNPPTTPAPTTTGSP